LKLQNALASLLSLTDQEKYARGIAHTPKEIHQQPETWVKTGQLVASISESLREQLERVGVKSPNPQHRPVVILAGAGTSDYIGKAVSRVLRREWGCEVMTIASTELLTNMEDFIRPEIKYLLISFSRSGESSEAVATLEHSIKHYPTQISHLVITCNAKGKMAQFPGVMTIVLDEDVNDRGLAMTSSFTNMIIAAQCLANIWNPASYESTLRDLEGMATRLMPEASDLASTLARAGYSRMCFIGAGSLQAVALESSLKVLELNAGNIATIAESPLGLRHGPLSFVNDQTLLVAYLSAQQPRLEYEIDLLEEIAKKKLARDVVVVAPGVTKRVADFASHVLSLEVPSTVQDAYRAPVDVILGQLLGLFTSLENDMLPDSPSAGAIGRVVSHVRIYPP
jgi:tagatose-6-phosphate ketose/aldose isomerase